MPTALDSTLPEHVVEACRGALGLRPRDGVLVAVSAGADSTALACLLAEAGSRGLPLRLVLGHVDHGWRGAEEARADREHVEALARQLDLPLVFAGPPPEGAAAGEDAARRFRYRALAAMAAEHRCKHVATGHHAGDQAETFLLRLLRGAGLVGLAGIPARRPLHPGLIVVRPLLDAEPEALRRWLRARGVPWREDVTNADLSRDRAAVRARLEKTHARSLAAFATRLRRRLERRVARIRANAASSFRHHALAGAVTMPRADLLDLEGEDLALALRLAGEHLEADRDGPWFVRRHVARLRELLQHGGELDLPRGLFLHVAGSTAWLASRQQPDVSLPELRVRIVDRAAFDLEAWRTQVHGRRAAVDADRLGHTALRRLERGDRFTPLGGGGRETTVKAWLSKAGVPAFVRRGQLVVVGERGVAWVVGRRLDAGHAVTDETKRVAILTV
ncbi:MAG: tRNA lysidine(34) synthetase TilS, partial [Planctomycetota bacterium]|nr:tRNA lysidine(34) synthetase TilS [Planctomycetota bacterium]